MNQIAKTQGKMPLLRNDSGTIVLIAAVLLPTFLGIAALAIDIGRMMVEHN